MSKTVNIAELRAKVRAAELDELDARQVAEAAGEQPWSPEAEERYRRARVEYRKAQERHRLLRAELIRAERENPQPLWIKIVTPFGSWSGPCSEAAGLPTEQALEAVYRAFNRVDTADDERLARIGYRLPSLSVGHVVHLLDADESYVVEPIGFRRLTDGCARCGTEDTGRMDPDSDLCVDCQSA